MNDTRPRFPYRLPDGTLVRVIYDHGEAPASKITFQLKGGEIVFATLVQGVDLDQGI